MDPIEVRVSAPATIANLGPGYDIVGLALDRPRDRLKARLFKGGADSLIVSGVGGETVSPAPEKNSCTVAARAVLRAVGRKNLHMEMELIKGVPPRMGMGSSGASSVAGAFSVNYILGNPLSYAELLLCAMEGERAACGAAHADNVAPALMGGVTVMVEMDPPRVVRLDPPKKVKVVVVSPKMNVGDEKTKLAREALPKRVPLPVVVGQISAFSSLLLGIVRGDMDLTGKGISRDAIVEPARAKLIPGFGRLKRAALEEGAYGFSISGAGPSVFALSPPEKAEAIGRAVSGAFGDEGLESSYGCYLCGEEGARVVR